MKIHRLCATKMCALLALNWAIVTSLATPPGGGTPAKPDDVLDDVLFWPNPGLVISASPKSCNGSLINADNPPMVTGTNVSIGFEVSAGLYGGSNTWSKTGALATGVTLNGWKVTFTDSGGTDGDIPEKTMTATSLWTTGADVGYYNFDIRFASTHFKNGDLKVKIQAKVCILTGSGAGEEKWTPEKEVTIKVYNKALVFATKERTFGLNNQYLATDDITPQAKTTTVSRDGASKAKSILTQSEVNHDILNPQKDVHDYLKADVLNTLKEATLILPVTHGLAASGRATGIRPSQGQVMFSSLVVPPPDYVRAPTSSELSQTASEDITLATMNNAIFSGRTAPNKVNFALMFCCNLGNWNTQVAVSNVFGILDDQIDPALNSVDQACLLYFGTLFADPNADPNVIGQVTLATYIEELLIELKSGVTIEEARKKLADAPKYAWLFKKGKMIRRGDPLSKLSYVYINKTEQATLAKSHKQKWYKL